VQGNRKQAVSIRLGTADVRKMKQLAERLGVRDSDVIRFALKSTLNRLGALCDPEIRGANLVPAIVEAGPDFIRYFDLDAVRLDAILNAGADPSRRVSHDDVALVSLAGSQPEYAMLRLNHPGPNGVRALTGRAASVDALRQHLYDKYVFRGDDGYARSQPVDEGDDARAGDGGRPVVGSA
jgi:hypothetical protein